MFLYFQNEIIPFVHNISTETINTSDILIDALKDTPDRNYKSISKYRKSNLKM